MTKRQPSATHPKAAPDQLLSIAIAKLASTPQSNGIWKSCSDTERARTSQYFRRASISQIEFVHD
jgi:hypothetical protein